jgi:hypothetical protein
MAANKGRPSTYSSEKTSWQPAGLRKMSRHQSLECNLYLSLKALKANLIFASSVTLYIYSMHA